MIVPREPQPGERLDATWGRDVIKALKQLRVIGGPGARVTTGPNGTTISVKSATAKVSSESTGSDTSPYSLVIRESNDTHFASVLFNDAAFQSNGEFAECINAQSPDLPPRWYDVASSFSSTLSPTVSALENVFTYSEEVRDIYAFIYLQDGVMKAAIKFDEDWMTAVEAKNRMTVIYIGSMERIDEGEGKDTVITFSVNNQVMKSGVASNLGTDVAPDAIQGVHLTTDYPTQIAPGGNIDDPAYKNETLFSKPGWTRGVTVDNDTQKLVGVKMTICTDIAIVSRQVVASFAEVCFDETGRLVSIMPHQHWIRTKL